MRWQAYVVTSLDRVLDGSFHRLLETLNIPNQDIYVGFRGPGFETVSEVLEHLTSLPFATSLSRARNTLLDTYPPASDSIVCFPDDDCWYGHGTVEIVEDYLGTNDLVLGVVDTDGTENLPSKVQNKVDLGVALRVTASAALFCTSEAFGKFRFDEKLGLGSKFKSGEDLDLALFILSRGFTGIYSADVRVGHPKKNREMEYFPGSIAVLRKYSSHWMVIPFLIARRVIHGCIYFAFGRLDIGTFRLSIQAAVEKS